MIAHNKLAARSVITMLRDGFIQLAGNQRLKIYGTLRCQSGKRMKVKNRVFFGSESEAIRNGFRPCGHCMKEKYKLWNCLK